MVLGGIILTFRQKLWGGFLLFAFAMALEISANHFQMTYYLLLLVLVLGVAYLVDAYRRKALPEYFKALGIMVIAVILAIGANATNLMATQEYTAHSTRGNTGLTIEPDGSPKPASGLDLSYITEYSYGIMESFDLFIPRFMGGSNAETLTKDAEVYKELLKLGASPVQAADFVKNVPSYWGDQPYVGAPAYIGATVIFLFIFALFFIRGRLKWWLVGGSLAGAAAFLGKELRLSNRVFCGLYSAIQQV